MSSLSNLWTKGLFLIREATLFIFNLPYLFEINPLKRYSLLCSYHIIIFSFKQNIKDDLGIPLRVRLFETPLRFGPIGHPAIA